MVNKVRLYVNQPLAQAQTVPLTKEQSNYLFAVMRLNEGDHITLINGIDGTWSAEVTKAHKKSGTLLCLTQTAPLYLPPDLWLAIAPLKKERMAMVVEKAVELGVREILLVETEYTNGAQKIRMDKLEAIMIEAAEQCGANHIPKLTDCTRFDAFIDAWPKERRLMFCDEARLEKGAALEQGHHPWGILIGPEGGFSPKERDALYNMPQTKAVQLGPRILRAETAAIAAITLWQAQLGDWQ